MKPILLAFTAVAAMTLQGCGSLVLSTVAALHAQSPLQADPAGFEIAVDLPDGVIIPENGATFGLSMAHSGTGESFNATYALQRRAASDDRSLFRINPDDLDEVRRYQTQAIAWETRNPIASSGSFSVGVIFCAINDGPTMDARFSTAIRTEVDGDFMPLVRNALVSDVIEAVEKIGNIPFSPICE